MGSDNVFSVTAMFVMFRECMEAAVILAVLLQYVTKTGKLHLRKQVWLGAGLGFLLSLVFAVVFIIIYYTLDHEVFTGKGEAIFEGIVCIIASVMITVLAFGMLKMMELQKKWDRKLKAATLEVVETGKRKFVVTYALFIIAFTAVLREGIESVLFLAGVGVNTPWRAIPLGGAVGAVLGVCLGYVLFFGLKPVQLRWFFYISTVILLFIAAGLFMSGFGEFQEAGAFGYSAEEDEDDDGGSEDNAIAPGPSPVEEEDRFVPWQNRPLWNICKCCDDEDQGFFELARALVGYVCDPTIIQVVAYIAYWLLVLVIVAVKVKRGTLNKYKFEDEGLEKDVGAADVAADVTKGDLEAAPAGALKA